MVKLAAFCGMLVFGVVVAIAAMMPSDVTERSFLYWLAETAEESKVAAIEQSPQMLAARSEIEDLKVSLAASEAYCAPAPTLKAAVFGWFPWVD